MYSLVSGVTKRKLVDSRSARDAGISLHGSWKAMEEHKRNPKLKETKAREAGQRTAVQIGPFQRPTNTLDFHDMKSSDQYRHVAIVRVPWLDQSARKLERGFYCLGCEGLTQVPLHYRRLFSTASFDEHLRQHGPVSYDRDRLNYVHAREGKASLGTEDMT
jgi:hypothetical protein